MDIENLNNRVKTLEDTVSKHEIGIPKIHLILKQFSKAVDKFETTVDKLDTRLLENDKQTAVNTSKQTKLTKTEKIWAYAGGIFTILVVLQMVLNTFAK